MPTDMKIVEQAFRFGCGRYVQEQGAAKRAGEEVKRIDRNAKKAFVIGGPVALGLCGEDILSSLGSAGIEPYVFTYKGFCNPSRGDEIVSMPEFREYGREGIVIGVGGGNIMDVAKYCAMTSGSRLLNVTTSSATCAACTPLSVLYNDRNGYIKSQHWPVEIGGVIADMDVIAKEPRRLLVSGLFDSVAKLPEISQRLKGKNTDETDIGLLSASVLADFLHDRLFALLPEAARDLENGVQSKALYDAVFLSVGLTGCVSSISRGSGQSALAHKIYETSRTLFPDEVKDLLHGEIVSVGIIVQKFFNDEGDPSSAEEFRRVLREYGMPLSISELGVPKSDKTVDAYYDLIAASSALAGTSDAEKALFRRALEFAL